MVSISLANVLAPDAETLERGAFVAGEEVDAVVFVVGGEGAEVEGFGGDVVLGQSRAGEEGGGEEGGELHLDVVVGCSNVGSFQSGDGEVVVKTTAVRPLLYQTTSNELSQ